MRIKNFSGWPKSLKILGWLSLALIAGAASASTTVTQADTFGGMAGNLNSQFTAIGNLMLNTAYIAGLGFGIAAIFKFKQHKDNPTQVPIGTPFALLAVSVLLVFLPGLYTPAAKSIYGTTQGIAAGTSGAGMSMMPTGQ